MKRRKRGRVKGMPGGFFNGGWPNSGPPFTSSNWQSPPQFQQLPINWNQMMGTMDKISQMAKSVNSTYQSVNPIFKMFQSFMGK